MTEATRLVVRAAGADDADLLAAWAVAMARETEGRELDPATVLAGVSAGIADPARARYFVAARQAVAGGRETLSEPVGTLMLTREWSDWRNGEWWWIQSVYVVPGRRRRGVFRALYRHVEALARETAGVVGLRLYVERDNADARRTYEALGMVDAGYDLLEAEYTAG
ncbi:GNAT family N-acetyltransferase [Novilysobacter defluvii]|uniref:GCN5 family acetyltransferase n=1 Tax=Lysobacter defluvii IMMIB APB-9 = DSM 18482 TaxID=1385515 RepID=A0A0A0MA50_9GAMM|nr:GNAT family N-acetyltransferase [Lysobacter defluvii]KGO98882.1 GCN5 family acetyltransferase [Lysobacter defluvii IMMIB APB-9 = DSM 18482]